MNEDIVPLFAIFFLFGAPVTAWIISRVLAHQERMEMIRQGFVPPTDPRLMRRAAKMGWQAGPVPPGMPNAGGPMPNVPPPGAGYLEPNYYAQAQMRKGISVSAVGLALLIGLSFIGAHGDGTFTFGPWLLGGLIPLFVGIAQVINATLNGAQLPGLGSHASSAPGPTAYGSRPQTGQTPPPPQPPSAPYAGWRPGPTPEIEKPASPPDFR
ncbi:MAG: hypothetical protein ABI282_02610 [Candidatus Baltobacteraceae bacterium]